MINDCLFRRRLLINNDRDNCVTIRFGQVGYPGTASVLGENFDISNVDKITLNYKNIETFKSYTYEEIPEFQFYSIHFNNLTDCSHMLEGCVYSGTGARNLCSINLSNLNTKNVTSTKAMFKEGDIGKFIGLDKLDTSNVTDMSEMFFRVNTGYNYILDLNSWDTSKVETFEKMFSSASLDSFTPLILYSDSWDTSNATNMFQMFYNQLAMTQLDLSNWDTSKVTNMSGMFQRCLSLQSLKMLGPTNPQADVTDMFKDVKSEGTFYYNPNYDYSHIIAQLPDTWTAVPIEQ